jgi:uncharacterized protein YbaR (Trm112 family)
MSEILVCPKCKSEYELQSSFEDESIIVSQTACKCDNTPKLVQGKKFLDSIMNELDKLFKKGKK